MNRLRVGVIGAGRAFERLHYPAYNKLQDHYQIAAICDTDTAKLRRWGEELSLGGGDLYADWRAMVSREDLDVIDIMVPIEQNYAITEEVAKTLAGKRKGIICEKPLAPTFEQALRARELAQRYRVPIMIAENYRYNEESNSIRDMVKSRRIGDVMYFTYNRVMDFPAEMWGDEFAAAEWRQHPEFPGGTITDSAVHDLASIRHIFGGIGRLQAFGRPQTEEFSPYSVVVVNLLLKSGLVGQYSFFCAGKEAQRPLSGFRVFGTEGMIYLEEPNCGTINVAYNDGRHEGIPYEPGKGYYNELLNFAKSLSEQEPISVPPEMEYGDLKTVQDILKSIQQNRVVGVDKTGEYVPSYIDLYSGPEEEGTYIH